MKKDFEFIVDLVEEFTCQKYIIDKLNQFEVLELTGWEIWFQIEFALFLENHTNIKKWEREKNYIRDRRKALLGGVVAIDFIIKKVNAKKAQYIAIELKQNNSMSKCVNNMICDINKIELLKPTELEQIRCLVNIGIHLVPKRKMMTDLLDESDIKSMTKHICCRKINNTNFAYTIF